MRAFASVLLEIILHLLGEIVYVVREGEIRHLQIKLST